MSTIRRMVIAGALAVPLALGVVGVASAAPLPLHTGPMMTGACDSHEFLNVVGAALSREHGRDKHGDKCGKGEHRRGGGHPGVTADNWNAGENFV